jgi:short-subunit dehydrogenase|tara:strand:+ start:168 stop:860 length:693 start_codon:yes stop_codon:yes gene_type:complete
MTRSVLIVGAGTGLSSSLALQCANLGMDVALAARNIEKLENLSIKTKASLHKCDASKIEDVSHLFEDLDTRLGTPELVVYNPSGRLRGAIETLDPNKTKEALDVTCFGAFLVAQQAAKRMLKKGSGSIFFTGASAGVKGFANSSVFAMGKFGLRGLAQSLARELHPKNVHISHFVIDGGIRSATRSDRESNGDCDMLEPDEIAKTYLQFHQQHKSAWAWEVELRPWMETF